MKVTKAFIYLLIAAGLTTLNALGQITAPTPPAMVECEPAGCINQLKFHGPQAEAHWGNGQMSNLTIEKYDGQSITMQRVDPQRPDSGSSGCLHRHAEGQRPGWHADMDLAGPRKPVRRHYELGGDALGDGGSGAGNWSGGPKAGKGKGFPLNHWGSALHDRKNPAGIYRAAEWNRWGHYDGQQRRCETPGRSQPQFAEPLDLQSLPCKRCANRDAGERFIQFHLGRRNAPGNQLSVIFAQRSCFRKWSTRSAKAKWTWMICPI